MKTMLRGCLLVGLALSMGGCVAACRPGHVGPYGGVHPGHCAVW
jgi:hypothetical protein